MKSPNLMPGPGDLWHPPEPPDDEPRYGPDCYDCGDCGTPEGCSRCGMVTPSPCPVCSGVWEHVDGCRQWRAYTDKHGVSVVNTLTGTVPVEDYDWDADPDNLVPF